MPKALFCRKYDIEKSVSILLKMDFVGAAFYLVNMAALVFSFSGGYTGYYQAGDINGYSKYKDLNTLILAISSLIVSTVTIPRLFAYLFVKEQPLEYYRRNAYFLIRAVTCGLLIVL